MAKIDESQIDKNRRTVAECTLESPWNTAMEDSDADYPQRIYDRLPQDRVGFLPPTEEE